MATTNHSTAEPPRAGRLRSNTQTRVLALLRARPVARSPEEIREVLGANKATVKTALNDLRRRGAVERVGTGLDTRYRATGGVPAQVAPATSLRGDRPRLLGLREAWLSLHQPAADEPGLADVGPVEVAS